MAQRTVDLYNLNLGDHAPHQFSGAQYVGPISIQIVPDYDEVAKHLPRGELDGQPERKGSWVVTARATFDDTAPPGILALPGVPNEGGIWDLCRLLTFITGSWVVTDPEALPRRNQNPASSRLCWPSKTFEVAAT